MTRRAVFWKRFMAASLSLWMVVCQSGISFGQEVSSDVFDTMIVEEDAGEDTDRSLDLNDSLESDLSGSVEGLIEDPGEEASAGAAGDASDTLNAPEDGIAEDSFIAAETSSEEEMEAAAPTEEDESAQKTDAETPADGNLAEAEGDSEEQIEEDIPVLLAGEEESADLTAADAAMDYVTVHLTITLHANGGCFAVNSGYTEDVEDSTYEKDLIFAEIGSLSDTTIYISKLDQPSLPDYTGNEIKFLGWSKSADNSTGLFLSTASGKVDIEKPETEEAIELDLYAIWDPYWTVTLESGNNMTLKDPETNETRQTITYFECSQASTVEAGYNFKKTKKLYCKKGSAIDLLSYIEPNNPHHNAGDRQPQADYVDENGNPTVHAGDVMVTGWGIPNSSGSVTPLFDSFNQETWPSWSENGIYNDWCKYKPTANITLRAIWDVSSYNVFLNNNDGAVSTVSLYWNRFARSDDDGKAYPTADDLRLIPTPWLPADITHDVDYFGWALSADAARDDVVITKEQIEGASFANPPLPLAEDTELYAIWRPYYTVTLNANGGYFPGTSQTISTLCCVKGNPLSLSHYRSMKTNQSDKVFAGWATDAAGTHIVYDALASNPDIYQPTSSTTLYAAWKESVTITLDANGLGEFDQDNTNVSSDPVTTFSFKWVKGEVLDLTPYEGVLSSDTGSILVGWSTDKDGTNKVYNYADETHTYAPTSSVTLYAQAGANAVKVTLNANGGRFKSLTGGAEPSVVSFMFTRRTSQGMLLTLMDIMKALQSQGYDRPYLPGMDSAYGSYSGWAASASSNVAVLGADDTSGTYNLTGNITLYAIFPTFYTVTLNPNGGYFLSEDGQSTYTSNETLLCKGGENAGLYLYNDRVKTNVQGKVFAGWAKDSKGTDPVYNLADDAPGFVPTADTTLYAMWRGDTYTVTLDGNGGVFKVWTDDTQTEYTEETQITLTVRITDGAGRVTVTDEDFEHPYLAAAAGNTDFDLLGWSQNSFAAEGDYLYLSTSGEENGPASTTIRSNTTLYAIWPNYHTVTLDMNGHGEALDPVCVLAGQALAEPADMFDGDGKYITVTEEGETYTFCGWYTSARLKEKYDFSSAVSSDLTLYAKWVGEEGEIPPEDMPYYLESSPTFASSLLRLAGSDPITEICFIGQGKADKEEDAEHYVDGYGSLPYTYLDDTDTLNEEDLLDDSMRIRGFFDEENGIVYVICSGVIRAADCTDMFAGLSDLSVLDMEDLNTSEAVSMEGMFRGCASLPSVDLSGMDASSATSMASMFEGCSSITAVELGTLDTARVTDMSSMFSGCTALRTAEFSLADDVLDTSAVTTMASMFYGCANLKEIYLDKLNTGAVTDASQMFSGCISLEMLDADGFSSSAMTDLAGFCSGCEQLEELSLKGWNTENVTDLSAAFYGCANLTEVDVSQWNTGNVTTMASLFNGCAKLASFEPGDNFRTSNVTKMQYMFSGCTSLETADLGGFNTAAVENMTGMLQGCSSLKELDLHSVDMSGVYAQAGVENAFAGLSSLEKIVLGESNVFSSTSLSGLPSEWVRVSDFAGAAVESESTVTADSFSSYEGSSMAGTYLHGDFFVLFHTSGETKIAPLVFSQDQAGTAVVSKPADPVREGYIFRGWYTVEEPEGDTPEYDFNTAVTSSLDIYAVYTPVTYMVYYDGNGGTGTMDPVLMNGSPVTLPAAVFTREYYLFDCWNTKADGSGTDFPAGKEVSLINDLDVSAAPPSITLYAMWKYGIQYNACGGVFMSPDEDGEGNIPDSGIKTVYFRDGETVRLLGVACSKEGYTSDGVWNTAADGSGEDYAVFSPATVDPDNNASGASGIVLKRGADGLTHLYMKWTENSYYIVYSYDDDGVKYRDGAVSSLTAAYSEEVTLPDATDVMIRRYLSEDTYPPSGRKVLIYKPGVFTKADGTELESYYADGWNTKPDGTGTFYPNGSVVSRLTGGVAAAELPTTQSAWFFLYPQWRGFPYTIRLDADLPDDAEIPVAPVDLPAEYGKGHVIPINAMSRPGYHLIGWNTESAAQKAANGDKTIEYPYGETEETENQVIIPDMTTTEDSVVTLYAVWEVNTYTVAFDSNEGSGTMAPLTVKYDTEFALPKNTFTREGYNFKGWNSEADGSGNSYGDQATVSNLTFRADDVVTLYAVWEKKSDEEPEEPEKPEKPKGLSVGQSGKDSSGSTYVVTGSTSVDFTAAANKSSVTVPDKVTLKGKTYLVTRIRANSFRGSRIRTVTVGANINKIEAKAFNKSKVKKLIILSKKLKKKSSVKGAFKGSKVKKITIKYGKVGKKYVKKSFTKKNLKAKKKVVLKK